MWLKAAHGKWRRGRTMRAARELDDGSGARRSRRGEHSALSLGMKRNRQPSSPTYLDIMACVALRSKSNPPALPLDGAAVASPDPTGPDILPLVNRSKCPAGWCMNEVRLGPVGRCKGKRGIPCRRRY